MYIYRFIFVWIYMCVYRYTYLHIYACISIIISLDEWINIYTYIYILYQCIYVRECLPIDVCIFLKSTYILYVCLHMYRGSALSQNLRNTKDEWKKKTIDIFLWSGTLRLHSRQQDYDCLWYRSCLPSISKVCSMHNFFHLLNL